MYLTIEHGLERAFGYVYGVVCAFVGSHGAALILMSVIVTLVTAPFTRYASSGQMKEKQIQDVLKSQIDKICSESSGAKRHARISSLYRRYAYHPIYSLRMALGLLTQIPFLMAAYYFLSNYKALEGRRFLFIRDLSRPDMVLWGINLLPIVMTLINMLSACIAPGFGRRETLRAWGIAFLFLALLYASPAALLLFWTCNNLWGLLENLRLYYVSEMENPFAAMFANCFAILRSLPGSFAGSRFVKFAPPAAFLVVMQAVVSASSAHLTQFDFAEAVIAITLCAVMLFFQTVFIILRERKRILFPWLNALPWISAAVSGGILYGSFWKYSLFDIKDIPETREVLFVLFNAIASASRGEARNVRLIVMGFFICLVMIVLFAKCGRKTDISGRQGPNGWDYAVIALSAIAPATFQALNNSDYLSFRTVWVYYAILVILAFAVYLMVSFIWRGRISERDTALIASVFMFCLIINPSAQGYFMRYGSPTLVFALMFLPFTALAASGERNSRNIALLLLISIIFPFVNFIRLFVSINLNLPEPVSVENNIKIPESNRDSVFLLVYDATPNLETLEALGVNSAPLGKILRSYGFKVYPNTYSIGNHSVLSMGLTYDIAYKTDGRNFRNLCDTCAGDSKAFRIFSRNSYGTCIIQDDYMTGGHSFADESFPPMRRIDFEKESLLSLLRGILIGEFRFDLRVELRTTDSNSSDESFHEFLRGNAAAKEGPWFTAAHYGHPGHSQNSGALLPNETELFVERYLEALAEMEKDIEAILIDKPSSIIIIMGDHGPYLTGDGVQLVNYSLDEITELMIRDRFGTLVAIRWPNPERASKYDADLLINQDIFPVVFAYLTDSDTPLDLMVKEKKAVMKERVFIDNGIFIQRSVKLRPLGRRYKEHPPKADKVLLFCSP
ncbi:MAG: YidC/Oxa1 family membrane protein insertase [Synergistaceae bacterium]|jgi:hypothetical protein|nr:YidC/Oxa1 family membrane protein insertase [Synergistaceae bacterium]